MGQNIKRGETGRKINSETDVADDLSLDLLIRIINDASIPLCNNPVLNCYFLILLIQKNESLAKFTEYMHIVAHAIYKPHR